MLLAIDVGNSHTVAGLFRDGRLRCHWRLNTNRDSTGDELAVLFYGLFAMEELTFEDVHGVVIASVVPPMQSAWITFSRKYVELDPLLVDNRLETGIPVKIDNPAEVGADRIVNAVAAFDRYRTALIVVDFGTATTFDCISEQGEYLGGAIAPGLAISLDALGRRTAKLPRIDISSPPERAVGTNTVAAIKSGMLFGYAGLVEGILTRLREEMAPARPKVVATGGQAALVAPYAPSLETMEPMLTLEGLRLLYDRHN